MGIMRDERKGKLLIRFGNADERCRNRSGILGQMKYPGKTGKEIAKATAKCFINFGTPCHGAPLYNSHVEPKQALSKCYRGFNMNLSIGRIASEMRSQHRPVNRIS